MSGERKNNRVGLLAMVIGVAMVGMGWAFWSYGGAAFIVVGVVVILIGLLLATGKRADGT